MSLFLPMPGAPGPRVHSAGQLDADGATSTDRASLYVSIAGLVVSIFVATKIHTMTQAKRLA